MSAAACLGNGDGPMQYMITVSLRPDIALWPMHSVSIVGAFHVQAADCTKRTMLKSIR